MSTTHSARVVLDIEMRELISAGVKAGVIPTKILESLDLTNGTADGKIDKAYYKRESSKAASGTTQYDLVGSLTDTEGNTVSFAEVCLILIRNLRTTALANLAVGPHSSNGFGALASGKGFWAGTNPTSVVGPEGWLCLYDKVGVPASAGSTDVLAVTCSAVAGDTNTWDILILGRSA